MPIYDCAIIGAGISGVGVALAAGAAGRKVVLVDRREPLSSTSANSLRIIHGGFRYLQKFQLARLYQSQKDQERLLSWAGEFIKPLKCIMPLKQYGLKSPVPAWLGCKLFHALTLRPERSLPPPVIVNSATLKREFSALSAEAQHGALIWHDALIENQHGFHSFLISQLHKQAIDIRVNSNILRITKSDDFEIELDDSKIRAKYLINTAGAWLEDIRTLVGIRSSGKIAWCKAFNISLSRQIEARYAFGLESSEGRLYFVVPRDLHSVIGTAYEPCNKESFAPPSEMELQRFITGFNSVMPQAELKLSDITGVDFGFLPIKGVVSGVPKLYDHAQITCHGRYIEVLSTKYTTFLSQGQEVVCYLS